MAKISVIGIDLAKKSWQLHGNDEKGRRLLKKTMTPEKAYQYLANINPCLIGVEACGGAHHAARKLCAMGHKVKIIAPQFVKPFVKGNRNDISDAEGIAEAVSRPNMRFIPIKQTEHQDIQNYHRMRERLVTSRVQLTNQIRGILFEYGIDVRKGDSHLKATMVSLCSHEHSEVTPLLKEQIADLYSELLDLEERLSRIDKRLKSIASSNELCKRLMKIQGVGPMIATGVVCCFPQVSEVKNGRQFSALLGLVPGHRHTGGPKKKVIMLPITKRGDRYLRKLIIQGARTAVKVCQRKNDPLSKWIQKLYEKKGYNKAAVALANKNARIMWALIAKNTEFDIKAAAA